MYGRADGIEHPVTRLDGRLCIMVSLKFCSARHVCEWDWKFVFRLLSVTHQLILTTYACQRSHSTFPIQVSTSISRLVCPWLNSLCIRLGKRAPNVMIPDS
jgi:hypothetical protein